VFLWVGLKVRIAVRRFFSLAFAGIVIGLANQPDVAAQDSGAALSLEQAQARSARVSDVAYHFEVRLDSELPEYVGSVRAQFELSDVNSDLTLDFAGGAVRAVLINGVEAVVFYDGYRVTLPAGSLVVGANEVEVGFSRPYSTDGTGLYRFVDPEDDRSYLFSDFEPFNQNRLFPSFDQPNLKARYSTRVTAPSEWVVVSITSESEITESGDERTWVFPASLPISTYVYALHAGEYEVWESRSGEIPLRLFARRSLARYVNPDEWFEFTRQGFEFFESYFGVPFPFGKYDQLIVPHFNWGAMENVGAVTFNERYVKRGAVTRQDRRAHASIIFHEMAHMWFGNLVTMDWWNGLWLNESFATFMATLALAEGTGFSEAWQVAFTRTIRAYRADEMETTHSIDLPVPDTDSAFANFDAITYEKGSAALKQLNYLVGPEAFRRGVGDYLKTYAYGNTTLDDFLGAISAAAGRDLGAWSQEWLLEPGTNSVAVKLECEDGRLSSLSLIQSAPQNWPTRRTHRTQLGLYRFEGDEVIVETLPVTYSGPQTGVETNGQPCPDLVYPNHGDWDFARARLEPDVLPILGRRLGNFSEPLSRAMLWQGVWEMVLETQLKVTDYVDFVLSNIARESDDAVLRQVLDTLEDALSYLIRLEPDLTRIDELGLKIEDFLWQQMFASPPGSDRRLFMFDQYVSSTTSAYGIQRLAAVLEGGEALPEGMDLDQDRRWDVVQVLSAFGHPAADRLIAAERGRDTTDQGRLAALTAEASRPDRATKIAWIEVLLSGDTELNLADIRAATQALFPDHQHELHMEFSEEILSGLHALNVNWEGSYLRPIMRGLLRPLCKQEYLTQLNAAIDGADELHPTLRRGLLEDRFAVRRCLALGEYLATNN